jgi:hypothetical protein
VCNSGVVRSTPNSTAVVSKSGDSAVAERWSGGSVQIRSQGVVAAWRGALVETGLASSLAGAGIHEVVRCWWFGEI